MNDFPIAFKLMPVSMLVGVLMIAISIPFLFNAIGPNRIYGFRTRKTLSNSDTWFKANKYMARELIAAGMVIILLAILAMLVHLRITMFTTIQAVALFIMVLDIPLMIAIIRSTLYLKKL